MTIAYPLQWPEGWPRTAEVQRKRGSFGTYARPLTFDRARRQVIDELRMLGAKDVVISTNLPIRQDGQPYADAARRRMDDPGVAIYFLLKGRQMVMAQDAYYDIASNVRSLGLAIEGMRQLERHGGGTMMERAFAGFAALPSPGASKPWREVLGLTSKMVPVTRSQIDTAFRDKAKTCHPDRGGSHALMAELNAARDAALREIGG